MNVDLRQHKNLIQELDRLFPLQNPRPTDSIETIRYNSGARSVVEKLLHELYRQEQEGEEYFKVLNSE
jgi:hypothetical protein